MWNRFKRPLIILFQEPVGLLWKHRRALWGITLNQVKARYAGSWLGKVWLVLAPLLFLASYAFVFIAILQVKVGFMTSAEYVLLIFCGLVPWLGFAEALSTGTSSVVAHRHLIKNTLFPIALIPIQAILAASVTQVVGFLILILLLGLSGKLGVVGLFSLVPFILQLFFTMGLIWLLSSLNVLIRDISQIVPTLIVLLMLISPIGYTEELIPQNLKFFMYFNPLYYLITLYRDPLIFNRLPSLEHLLIFGIITTAIFGLGYYVFSHLKEVFPDYV